MNSEIDAVEAPEPHDGEGWRIVVTGSRFVAERFDSDTGEWVGVQHWESQPVAGAQRGAAVVKSCREHGWVVDLPLPRAKAGRLVLAEVFPWQWERIVLEVTATKNELEKRTAQTVRAWRDTMLAAHTIGGISAPKVAALAGTTKRSVYREKAR